VLEVQFQSVSFGFSEVQQLVDELVQPFGIPRHDMQILLGLGVFHPFLFDDMLQRAFDEGKGGTYFVCHMSEEINLTLIEFPFFLLLQLVHCLLVFAPVAPVKIADREVSHCAGAEKIKQLCPEREQRMGLYHHFQAVFPGIPLSFAVLDSYAKQVFTSREVVESDAIIYSDRPPCIGKSLQNILHLIFLQLLIGQRDDTQGEGILIVCQFYLLRIGNVPAQRAAGSMVVYIGIIHDQLRCNESWRGVMPFEGTGRELHYAIVRPEVDVAFSVDSGRRDIELVVELRHLSREQL